MNSVCLSVFSSFLEFFFAYILSCAYLKTSLKKYKNCGLCLLVLTLLPVLAGRVISYTNYLWFIDAFIIFLYIFFVFRIPVQEALLLFSAVYATYLLFHLFAAICSIILPVRLSPGLVFVFANIFAFAASIFSYFFLPLHKVFSFIVKKKQYLQLLFINLFFIFLLTDLYYKIYEEQLFKFLFMLIAVLTMLLLVNLEIGINRVRLIQQERELKAYEEYIPIIEDLIDHVRGRQHDFNNQCIALQMLPEIYKDYDSLVNAMADYHKYITDNMHDYVLLKLNLKLVAGFLFQKTQYALKADKILYVDIINPLLKSTVPEYELIDILGVLADNAIEATPLGATAVLTLNSYENKIEITTRNPGPVLTENVRKLLFTKGYSTKSAIGCKRGFGLYNLKLLVEKHNGLITVYNDTDRKSGKTYLCFEILV